MGLYILIFLVSYLIGSVNTSIIVGKLMSGIDVREHGSGNAGATNALRTLGKKAGVLVLLGDCLKAVIACLIAKAVIKDDSLPIYIAGIGAVLGHNFPIYFKFRGGKGVLVSLVSILFADWRIGIIVFVISIIIITATKYVSLGSMTGAVLLVILAIFFRSSDLYYIAFTVILMILSLVMHRANIRRLISGTESKLGKSKV